MLRFGPEVCDTILMSFIVTQNVAHVLYANDYPPYAAECIVRVIFVTSDLAAAAAASLLLTGQSLLMEVLILMDKSRSVRLLRVASVMNCFPCRCSLAHST